MIQLIISILLIFTYGAMGAYVWGFWQNRPNDTYPLKYELMVMIPILLLQAWIVWEPLFRGHTVIFSFGNALNLVTWLMLVLYWSGSFFYQLKGLQILLFPLASLGIFLSVAFPGQHDGYLIENIPFVIHVGSSLLAYCLFGTSTLLAVLIIFLERDLHQRRMSALMRFLPPLLSLERLMFLGLWLGFGLLTISVISGTVFTEQVFGVEFHWTHKAVFGILSWLIYACLLWVRVRYSWRGSKVAGWVIIGFISLMFAYIGSKFVLEVILGRSIPK